MLGIRLLEGEILLWSLTIPTTIIVIVNDYYHFTTTIAGKAVLEKLTEAHKQTPHKQASPACFGFRALCMLICQS